ncbi:hypothetical protein P170DRAFT_415333 [Aspergillus steynii IBT 23096]|uniref:Autophagy-related protein 14 n=1 Tax=Aspergillus steynii IBT 23096 TaxID=1392250 RepID=A0A2I2FVN4_9EURO|nr:uncharacterized protein P170DRAFT_415333 [Aspergillus steynii IBT 23096]PLB44692.1 hypothetical protein P170DRAFT_415333 [Aspergillus steynii IBT 23096]
MSCHVCSRGLTLRQRLFCPTCARSQLYHLHHENVRILLERESISRQIEDAVTFDSTRNLSSAQSDKIASNLQERQYRSWIIQTIIDERSKSSARTKSLANQIERMKLEIKDKRRDISHRRRELARQDSDAESANYQLTEREATMLAGIQNNTKRTDHLWHSQHSKTAEARIFLCREAANLYGLRQKVKKRDGELKETYCIGGVPIINLKDINGASPAQISTSFSYIAHLLVLVSNYLSLRLPAEITLPHRNHPTPSILSPAGSYSAHEAGFAVAPISSASRPGDFRSHGSRPRPRPLHTDKTLPKLASEDPAAYALVLEGAALLAWNVSWLCRTQGLNIASDSWEETCDLGRNMWQLLFGSPAQPLTLVTAVTSREIQPKTKLSKELPKTTIQRTKSFSMLGHYSHGTVHSFLCASEGAEFTRTWRLPSPTKIADKLKSVLLGEMASAEWELLEKKEWDDAAQDIVYPPSINEGDRSHDQVSPSSTAHPEGNIVTAGEPFRSNGLKGTSGWTKLRNR